MKKVLLILMGIISLNLYSQNYPIGHKQYNFYDASRNRSIQTEVYYPATTAGDNQPFASGQFPLLIFGHGFVMSWDAYQNFWELLVPKGYIMAFPRTEGSITPSHSAFGEDLRFLNTYILSQGNDSVSDFYQKLTGTSAIMGHSMGGGSSVLAAANNTNLTALINFAAAETNPSAISAAANVSVPTLMFYGVNDGVAPPANHQLPIYQNLASSCKNIVGIIGGGHCYFANNNFNCSFGESTSNPQPTISRDEQQQIVAQILVPYLDFILKNDAQAEQLYYSRLNTMTSIVFDRSCTMNHDIDVLGFNLPINGCGLTNNQVISINIKNNGQNAESNIPLTFIFNGQAPVTEIYNGTIQPGETITYSFTSTVNASVSGSSYSFIVFSSLPNDQYLYNDTISQLLTNTSVALPISVDFTGFNGTNLSTIFPGWREAQGIVPSGTGSTWVNRTGVGGSTNTTAKVNFYSSPIREWILGPGFVCGQYTKLKFDVALTAYNSTNAYANGMGVNDSLRVFYSLDCGNTWQRLTAFGKNNNFTNNLQTIEISLSQFANQGLAIGFQAFRQNSSANDYDLHIDNIMIFNENPYDLSLVEFTSPIVNNCYSVENFQIKLKNTGLNQLDLGQENVSITLNITGPQSYTNNVNLSGTLVPNQEIIVDLGQYDIGNNGQYLITAQLNYLEDGNFSNNFLSRNINVSNPIVEITGNNDICEGQTTVLTANAQSGGNVNFQKSSTVSVNIPDNLGTGVLSTINISSSELSASFAASTSLKKVIIDSLIHTYVGDLKIELIAPDNSSIVLINKRGSTGDNFIRTELTTTASVSISTINSANAPFTGMYLPEQPFSNLTGNVVGNWKLKVADLGVGDVGTLHKWTLVFEVQNYIVSYTWSNNESSAQISVNPVQTTQYSVTVVDLSGCSQTDSFTVDVSSSNNSVDLGEDRFICQGSAVTIAAGIGYNNYLWNTQETTSSITVSNQGNYSVTVSDACGTYTDNVNVYVYPLPIVDLGNDINTCEGSNIILDAGLFNSYIWSTQQNTQTISLNTNMSGDYQYSVTVTDNNGCQNSDTINIQIFENPTVNLGNDFTICSTETFSLNAGSFSQYLWSTGDQTSSITIVANNLTPDTYLYWVSVTDNNGCIGYDEVNVFVEICNFTNEKNSDIVKIYPNPAVDYLIVEFTEDVTIQVIDNQGRIFYVSYNPLRTHNIDLSKLEPGQYYILTNNNQKLTFIKL